MVMWASAYLLCLLADSVMCRPTKGREAARPRSWSIEAQDEYLGGFCCVPALSRHQCYIIGDGSNLATPKPYFLDPWPYTLFSGPGWGPHRRRPAGRRPAAAAGGGRAAAGTQHRKVPLNWKRPYIAKVRVLRNSDRTPEQYGMIPRQANIQMLTPKF